MSEIEDVLLDVERKARSFADKHASLLDNWRYFLLHNKDRGVFGSRRDNQWRLTRREWIERNITIKTKGGAIVPMVFNAAQRRLEAEVLRFERRRLPVRILILKARQLGCSTYIVVLMLWLMFSTRMFKAKLVADVDSKGWELLDKMRLMLSDLHRDNGDRWRISLALDNKAQIALDEPFLSRLQTTSSRAPNIGHSETYEALHMTETSRWENAEDQAMGLEQAFPEVFGTYGFDETTANGAQGYFFQKFMRAWRRKLGLSEDDLGAASDAVLKGAGWTPIFFPWFIHQEYRLTAIHGWTELPQEVADEITRTLDAEEQVLLKQKYVLRGRGWMRVDLDQLGWRRYFISQKLNGSLDRFHEQYPAFPEEAFLASGRAAFDHKIIGVKMQTERSAPAWRGDLIDERGEPTLELETMRES